MQAKDVHIKDGSIKVGQFIKLANLVETGGAAKARIAEGVVTVNGEVINQRGTELHHGDVVCVDRLCARVSTDASDDDYFDEATANDDFDPEKWKNL